MKDTDVTTDGSVTMHDGLRRCFQTYTVILEPDRDEAEWWAGAPSVVRRGDGRFCLAARMRGNIQPRGRRGYEIRLMESDTGTGFSTVRSIRADQVAAPPCFERPALVVDPHTGRLRLYVCGPADQDSGLWGIFLFDEVDELADLDDSSIRLVLPPSPSGRKYEQRIGFKDPFVFYAAGQWHMYVIGYDLVERTYHFVSSDGRAWQPDPANPVLDNGDWHNFFTRPACVVAAPLGYFFVYEGSAHHWYDPGYNIATGLGHTLDLSSVTDLTPTAPLLQSTTPGDYHTWRYSNWLTVGDEMHVYAEVARPNNSSEIRRFVVPLDRIAPGLA